MGYTHYWTLKPYYTNEQWRAFIKDTRRLLTKYGDQHSAWSFGDDDNDVTIADATDVGEVFLFQNKECSSFCKTGEALYDVLVTAVLVLAKAHLGDAIVLKSDGDICDWFDGLVRAQKVAHFGNDFVRNLLHKK
ncbi:MAG: hypothetical protein A2122_00285 [Candidatus Liptonbacteria bacterium GWB1_49_6]|uniref:Uncharacterized protein n=1 Tax=Candidatus Liptonbacteria bacterium GWB1_49_6 TaxID=1798644 RepID=A0A1G2C9V3_9BACT|nr:MAG: hypothetical protein A2122_00285 [Candidatus Liptonbacteria bacterium GWB1_49_6]